MKSVIDMIAEDNNIDNGFREAVIGNGVCKFCGNQLTSTNRKLSNDFGGGWVEDFGCSHCIERPIEELKIPSQFDLTTENAKHAFDEYRQAIANAERKAGRL